MRISDWSSDVCSSDLAILERWFSRDLRDNDPVALAGWRAMLTRTPQAGYPGTSAAIRDADFTEEAKRIAVPTLCMIGAEAGATPPALVPELAALIPRPRHEVLEGTRNLPCIDRPVPVARRTPRFVKENGLVPET